MNRPLSLVSPTEPCVTLRAAGPGDLEQLRVWKNANKNGFFFQGDITPEMQKAWYGSYLLRPEDFMFVVEHEGRKVGCMGFRLQKDGSADVYNIIAAPGGAGRGLMKAAMALMCAHIAAHHTKDIGCLVVKGNPAAAFYEHCGFKIVAAGGDHHILKLAEDPVVVLGAGCAGLMAARRLREKGRPVRLVEAEDHVGGLAGGIVLGGDVYEYGPHVFHTTDAEILADIKTLMGKDLLPYERTIQIKFLGNYFKFPLSIPDVLLKLPLTTVLLAAGSFVYHFVKGAWAKPVQENSETLLQRYYGDVLYRLFFKDYIQRVWGIPPSAFSPSFARERIPRLNILDFLDKVVAAARDVFSSGAVMKTEGYVEKLEGQLWTTKKGFSMICERMAADALKKGARLRLSTRAVAVRREGGKVTAVELEYGGKREIVPCSGIVNTLAINDAARMFTPPLGDAAAAAAEALRFRAIVFVGLKVRRPKVLRASFMYFREHSFNRITDLAHFGFHMDPPGTTLLVAEVACDTKDPIWMDEALAVEAVVADLVREGILARAEVASSHVFRARHAHPMYTLGYEAALKTLLDAFAGLSNAETAGRQGRFQYVNTHVAMKMGLDAADRLDAKLPRMDNNGEMR
ncbi:MAG: FAD-dependent oxidoreductase [Elusimicrobiota bacterium]